MRWDEAQGLSEGAFRRLTGVTKPVYAQMVAVIAAYEARKTKGGRPSRLSVEDQVLLSLEFWREYRKRRWKLVDHDQLVCPDLVRWV